MITFVHYKIVMPLFYIFSLIYLECKVNLCMCIYKYEVQFFVSILEIEYIHIHGYVYVWIYIYTVSHKCEYTPHFSKKKKSIISQGTILKLNLDIF